MNIYIVKINNNLSGIFETLDIALDYVYSLLNSNLINNKNNVLIQTYKMNSCIILEEYTVDLNYTIEKKNKINYNNEVNFNIDFYEEDSESVTTNSSTEEETIISLTSSEKRRQKEKIKEILNNQNILGQQKIDTVHKLNLLKK